MHLANTVGFELEVVRGDAEDAIDFYSDSDLAGDRQACHHARSQSGTIILLNGMPVFWRSKKQPATSISSACAEIYALSETVREAQLLQWRLEEVGASLPYPILVQVDATCAISFQERTCPDTKLLGIIDMREQWVRELQDKCKVRCQKVATDRNFADLLTKCLTSAPFNRLCRLIRTGMGRVV